MTREQTLAEAKRATDRLIEIITSKLDWQMPEPKAVISLETAAAFAMLYAKERADAEAAAMRERAAEVADNHVATGYMSGRERDYCHQHGDEIAELIRALPATGEVGRG